MEITELEMTNSENFGVTLFFYQKTLAFSTCIYIFFMHLNFFQALNWLSNVN
jgi:hypothetical protein